MPAAYCAPTGGMEPEARRCSWTSRPPISTRVAGWRCGLIRDLVGLGHHRAADPRALAVCSAGRWAARILPARLTDEHFEVVMERKRLVAASYTSAA